MDFRRTSRARRFARCAISCIVALSAFTPIAAHADSIDDYVAAKMAELSIPGLVVAVLQDGQVVKQRAYGFANLELQVPATLDTAFGLASTTKVFTATAIMQLVEQHRIALDQPVRQILRDLPQSWDKVTIRNCLNHTTGLPYATEDKINATAIEGNRGRLPARLADKPVVPPGTRIDYNTTDYVLLAMVIESLSGLSYTDYPTLPAGSVRDEDRAFRRRLVDHSRSSGFIYERPHY